jgi:hypothetical protein
MANEMNNNISNFTPEVSRKGEGKTLPTWEFFYTGTLWRLTRGLRGRNVNPVPNTVSFTLERR